MKKHFGGWVVVRKDIGLGQRVEVVRKLVVCV